MTTAIAIGVFLLLSGFGLAAIRFVERAGRRLGGGGSGQMTGPAGEDGAPDDSPRRSALEHVALGFLCGTALVGAIGQVGIWMGLRLNGTFWPVLGGVAGAMIVVAVVLDSRDLRERWSRFRGNPRSLLPVGPVGWGLAILTLAAVVWSFRQAFGLPITGWDPLSFWYLKTKILLHEGTVFCPDFLDADRFHAHTDYPILVNIVEAGICRALGGYLEMPLKLFLAVWEAACLVVAGSVLARRRGSTVAWAGVALMALLPAMTDYDTTGAVSAYRDAPLALAILAAAAVAIEAVDQRRFRWGTVARLVLLLVLVLGTKREGTLWAAMIGAAAAAAMLRKPSPATGPAPSFRRAILAAAFYLVLPMAVMLPWFLIRAELPHPRSEEFTKVMEEQRWEVTGERTAVVLEDLRDELFLRVQKWGGLWWVFAAVGLWRWRGWTPRERLFALLVPAGWLMTSMGFVFTPWADPRTHLAVSIDRLVLQGALLAIWLLTVNLTRREE